VLASSLPARDYAATPALFRGANATKRQLRDAEGLVGFSLLARPLRKQYGSLSVWRDEAALQEFARSSPRGQLMRDLAPRMGETAFVRWTIPGSAGRPSWREAWARLASAGAGA
jgi:heme-degrading monooxygenase HmoA